MSQGQAEREAAQPAASRRVVARGVGPRHLDPIKFRSNFRRFSSSSWQQSIKHSMGALVFAFGLTLLLLLLGPLDSKSQITANIVTTNKASNSKLPNREVEKQIVDRILGEGYDKRIRPSGLQVSNKTGEAKDGPALVRVNMFIRSISKIDDVTMEYSVQLSLRQEWVDERLAFSRKFPTDIKQITLTEQERLWKPDLFFRNEKEGHFHKIIMPNVLIRINGDGAVLYSIRISLVLACPMHLKYYPLDKQNCTIEMASYGYTEDDLKFLWKEQNPVQINRPLTLPRFTLEQQLPASCTSKTATGVYSCLRVDLIFNREFSYYLIQIYIPCCMLVIVSWVSFWLDPNAIPARVSLGVTTLLTMATQISGINASLPPVSYIKAIDVWTGICLTFVFSALLEFALVNYASRRGMSHAHKIQKRAMAEEERELWERRQLAELMASQQQQQQAAAAAYYQPQPQQLHPNQQPHFHHYQQQQQQQHQQLIRQRSLQNGPYQFPLGNGAPTYSAAMAGQQHQQPSQAAPTPAAAAAAAQAADPGNQKQQHQPVRQQPVGLSPTRQASNNGQQQHYLAGAGKPEVVEPHLTGGSKVAANGQLGAINGFPLAEAKTEQACELRQHQSILRQSYCCLTGGRDSIDEQAELTGGRPARVGVGGRGGGNFLVGYVRKKVDNYKRVSCSKKIDVISRISFPFFFALFNLFYWTVYLFREDDIVRE